VCACHGQYITCVDHVPRDVHSEGGEAPTVKCHLDSHPFIQQSRWSFHKHPITAMPSLTSFSAALLALVALLTISTITPVVEATALTYNVAAHERACFYTYAPIAKKKLAFYFAVS